MIRWKLHSRQQTDGDTVKVLKNCGLSKAVSVDKALTLDLNGKVVKVKIVPEAKAKQTISAFAVAESVTFTVLNGLLGGSGKGQITVRSRQTAEQSF